MLSQLSSRQEVTISVPNYILRNIDDRLWARVKTRAQQDNTPLRALILALLRAYADRSVSITEATAAQNE